MFDQFNPYQPIQFLDGLLGVQEGMGLASATLVLIDRTAGTNIGNMTTSGGLAAAFDGNTNQTAGNSAEATSGANNWIGKTLASAKVFGRAEIYGASNQGIIKNSNPSATVNIRGKNGAAPSSGTDGTIIGTITFTDTTDGTMRTIDSTDLVNTWDHIFMQVTNNAPTNVAELVLYEWA